MTTSIQGEIEYDASMASHTSWRTGGKAKVLFTPADLDDLVVYMSGLTVDEPVLWVGLGSNLLVRDGGFDGTVILVSPGLSDWSVQGQTFIAQCGVPCAKVARNSAREHLVGAGFLAGIPGTVGGALAMNAGAFGGETWDIVTAVETLDRNGCIHRRTPEEFKIGYRSVQGPDAEWFVSAEFSLQSGDSEVAAQKIKAMLDKRNATQPIGKHSCGSVFRNPPGDHAARLIESCGLKGYAIGGASVSEKHANFILNNGDATAGDIESLISLIAATVADKCAVVLQPEVRIVGESAGGLVGRE